MTTTAPRKASYKVMYLPKGYQRRMSWAFCDTIQEARKARRKETRRLVREFEIEIPGTFSIVNAAGKTVR